MNKKTVFYTIFILFALLFTEIVLRICFPLPELSNFNRINYQILDRKDDYSAYLRNIRMSWKSSLDTNHEFIHQLNGYGYRDSKEWKIEKEEGKRRIFFLGDSFVEGMMSSEDATIPVGYEKAAANGEAVEWFNCGMMGIGLNEYIKFIKDAVPLFLPDEVYLIMYSNDAPFQRAYVPQNRLLPKRYSFWKPRLLEIFKHISKEDPIPFRFLTEKRPFYKPVPDPGNPWTRNAQSLSKEVTPAIAEAMKKGDFNYFRTNWILEEEKFLKSEIEVKSKLAFIRDYLKQYQCKLTVFYIPSRSQVTNYYYQFERQACLQKCPDYIDLTDPMYQVHAQRLASDCNSLSIPFFDLTKLVRQEEEKGNHLYWNYDDHMRAKGYLLLGKAIYNLTHK